MALDLEALLTYPMESDDWIVTVAIGTVLTIFSFLIIPGFLVYGYLVRALRAGMDGASEPPEFDDWGTLFVEGLIATVILFVYQLIPGRSPRWPAEAKPAPDSASPGSSAGSS
jgi:hypothetical protein